jgi:hypothetical protein
VRNITQPEPDVIEFDAGTDSNMGGAPIRLQSSMGMIPQQETLPTFPNQPVPGLIPGVNGVPIPSQDVFRPNMPPGVPSPFPPPGMPAPPMIMAPPDH